MNCECGGLIIQPELGFPVCSTCGLVVDEIPLSNQTPYTEFDCVSRNRGERLHKINSNFQMRHLNCNHKHLAELYLRKQISLVVPDVPENIMRLFIGYYNRKKRLEGRKLIIPLFVTFCRQIRYKLPPDVQSIVKGIVAKNPYQIPDYFIELKRGLDAFAQVDKTEAMKELKKWIGKRKPAIAAALACFASVKGVKWGLRTMLASFYKIAASALSFSEMIAKNQ